MADQESGIDVSNHQNRAAEAARRPIDWEAVARTGLKFLWAKAFEGANPGRGTDAYWDPYLGENCHGAAAAGIPSGGYDFARPGDARLEARQFADYLKTEGLLGSESLRPMLDVEDIGVGDAWIAAWIDELRRVTGVRRVIVYANRDFYRNRLHPELWADDDVLLWLADYDFATDSLKWNDPKLAVKQYRSDGAVDGLTGSIDMNVTVNGYSVADLTIGGDSDMQVTDRIENAWGGTPTVAEVWKFTDLRAAQAAEGVARIEQNQAAHTAALAALAQDSAITADGLRAVIENAVRDTNASLLSLFESVLARQLGKDNAEQARAVIAELTKLLNHAATPPSEGQ